MATPLASDPTPDHVPEGNLAASLDAILEGFGVVRASSQDALSAAIEIHLVERALAASIVEIRSGTLTLLADPTNAALLRYETDQLIRLCESVAPASVNKVRVRVRR
jgi:hypothetical protein